MDNFIKMDIETLLEIQQELKYLSKINAPITDEKLIEQFKENIEFFQSIYEDIECIFNDFLPS